MYVYVLNEVEIEVIVDIDLIYYVVCIAAILYPNVQSPNVIFFCSSPSFDLVHVPKVQAQIQKQTKDLEKNCL